jgi:hypothetical protein
MMVHEHWYDSDTGLRLKRLVTSGKRKVIESEIISFRT